MLETLKTLDSDRMDALLKAAPRKVREELYRRLGIKAKSSAFSLKSRANEKGGRVLASLADGKDPGREVLEELVRSYLFGRRALLSSALDHLKVRHSEGLTDQDLEFLEALEPKQVMALQEALAEHDPVDVRLYLDLMRVPHQAG
ncbi:MAG: hypothetical protein AAGD10_00355 [Myxococcota bacterium]